MIFDWDPIFLSLKLATITTIVLIVPAIFLAYWLSFAESKLKLFLEPVVSLPLVLPPTVLGFYLLVFFSPYAPLGSFLENIFHVKIIFTFFGLVIGSMIFSLPFMVNPIKSALETFPHSLIESSYVLGKSKFQTLGHVVLPNIKPAIITAVVMTFAHTLGEFGVVLMIGGSIPEQTRTASIAIFNDVESLNYAYAHIYSMIFLIIAYTMLLGISFLNYKKKKINA